jgi:hypothetical protein
MDPVIEGVTYNYITATRNANDYNSIRNIMKSISDASETNRYVINIPSGRWFECDIQGKEFITLRGANKNDTVLYCDGSSTTVMTPSDYSFAGQENKALNLVPKMNKHVVFALQSLKCENLTIEGIQIKYPVHSDSAGIFRLDFNNCIITLMPTTDMMTLVGIGIWGGQSINFNGCTFKRLTAVNANNNYGVYIHNWNDQSSPSSVTFKNSTFVNCPYALLEDLGSGQIDTISFENCQSDYQGNLYWAAANSGIGYSLRLHYINTIFAQIIPTYPWSLTTYNRPLYLNFINN